MAEKKGFFNFLKLDNLIEHFTALIESRIMIAKIEFKEEMAQILSRGLVAFLLIFIGTLCFLFLNVALALVIGDVLQNPSFGFLLVSGFYLIIFVALFLLKDKLGLHQYFERKLSDLLGLKSKD